MTMRPDKFDVVIDSDEFHVRDMREGALYVVPNWWKGRTAIGFICPCGCGSLHIIPTHSEGETPNECSWQLNRTGDKITLNPSLLNTKCGAHFFIRENKIIWCN